MVMKIFKFLTVISIILSSFSFSIIANAGIGDELRNGEAFSGKNSYFMGAGYSISTSYSMHSSAYNNAINKINNISGANIDVATYPIINITMKSVNSLSYDYYGHADWTAQSAALLINEALCSQDGFAQDNYNKTALHELGHAFYMVHQASTVDSVMKSGKYSYNDYSSLDKSNFSYQY